MCNPWVEENRNESEAAGADGIYRPPMMFGIAHPPSVWHPERSLVEAPSVGLGTVIVRVGRENDGGMTGWHRTEHVVLTTREARILADKLIAAADRGDDRADVLGDLG
jgi:hypothetical protein